MWPQFAKHAKQLSRTPFGRPRLAELGGADGITLHLREDRRHIQDRDLRVMKETVQVKLNLEMAAAPEITKIALDVKPGQITLVPEKREEITTEGGLDVTNGGDRLRNCVEEFLTAGIETSLFIDPEISQVEASKKLGVQAIELHTGCYADATTPDEIEHEYDRLLEASRFAVQQGLVVHMGHGLTYRNVQQIARIDSVCELNIGHSIVARAVMVGFKQAVSEMKALIQ